LSFYIATFLFSVSLAVILSAQTTDGKVNGVTKELFAKFGSPSLLAAADIQDVHDIIHPVGLAPQKSKNLVNMAKMLVNDFNEVIPSNYQDLEKLPGVGHKTASVVMSQCFGEINCMNCC